MPIGIAISDNNSESENNLEDELPIEPNKDEVDQLNKQPEPSVSTYTVPTDPIGNNILSPEDTVEARINTKRFNKLYMLRTVTDPTSKRFRILYGAFDSLEPLLLLLQYYRNCD